MSSQIQKEALLLKQQGNKYFQMKQYQEAIQKYTQAIVNIRLYRTYALPSVYCIQIDLDAIQDQNNMINYLDAENAVKYDDKNIKAYYLMGQSLVQIAVHSRDKSKILMAIEKLKKSLVLCPSQGKVDFQQRFIDQIYKAKKKLWQIQIQNNLDKKKALRSYLISIVQNDITLNQAQKDRQNQNIIKFINKKYGQKSEIPRSLICFISKKIMKDPICNEYGNSYSKKQYIQFTKENKTDPLTGKPLFSFLLYPNLNLKKAIEGFLQKQPWAYDEKIQF